MPIRRPETELISPQRSWRCRRCDKLLGILSGDRLHLRFARQHEYHAALPASCTCRGCGALNELASLTAQPR